MSSVTILQPIYGTVFPRPSLAFAALVSGTLGARWDVKIDQGIVPYIDCARNSLIRIAIENDTEWVFWCDQDMIVPHDAIPTLASHGKEVVSGLYFRKGEPFEPIPWQWNNDEDDTISYYTGYKPKKLQKIGGSGFGCLIMRTDVLREMEKHYGDQLWCNQIDQRGEDVWFSRRLTDMGIQMWLDPKVKCGHAGEYIVGEADFLRCR